MMTVQTGAAVETGRRYPDETKEIAYQLWAFVTARNCSAVCRAMAEEEYGVAEVPPYQTVAYWAREYGWADRATKDVQSIAPDLRHQAFSELLFAGLDGARYIRRVNAGTEQPDKVRAMLAVAAVDRIGFSPVGKGMPAIDAPSTGTAKHEYSIEELRKLPPDELMRLEQQYREGKA